MKTVIFGTGYVGLLKGNCFDVTRSKFTSVDIDKAHEYKQTIKYE